MKSESKRRLGYSGQTYYDTAICGLVYESPARNLVCVRNASHEGICAYRPYPGLHFANWRLPTNWVIA